MNRRDAIKILGGAAAVAMGIQAPESSGQLPQWTITLDNPVLPSPKLEWHDMSTPEGVMGHMRDMMLYGQAHGVYPPKSLPVPQEEPYRLSFVLP